MMRTEKAIKNALFGMGSYFVLMLSNFITRAVMTRLLGNEFVGLEGLLKNIISMLALAELGLGTGLVYKLYRPIADGDKKQIKHILNFYKKAYQIIALVILAAGLLLSFIVHIFVKEKQYTPVYIGIAFMLFLLDVLASYWYANRKALLLADQKNYVINQNDVFIQLSTMVVQVLLLFLLQGLGKYVSFLIYAVVRILCRMAGALMIAVRFRRLYPDIAADPDQTTISEEERKPLMKNIRAMLCHKIGAFSVLSSASIIITNFVGLAVNGMYTNYMLVVNTISQLILQIFNGITASFGSLLSTGSSEKAYEKFNLLYFMNYFIYCFCTTSLFVLMQPFVGLVFGKDTLLGTDTLVLFCCYFYVFGIRRVILMSKDSAGLFRPDRYMALLEAALNIVMALVFVQFWGINGVLLASILSQLIIPLWTQPYLVYKNILKHSLKPYYLKYLLYAGLTAFSAGFTYWVASLLPFENVFLVLIFRAVLCLIIPNGLNLLVFWKTEELQSFKTLGVAILKKLTGKARKTK